jgi:hypothetical protein
MHRCHHVFHVGPNTSSTAHVAWDSPQLFTPGPIGIQVTYAPVLPTDGALQTEPIGSCGLHFVVNTRFSGVATLCGHDKLLPLHVQIANVNHKRLRVGLIYWGPLPFFTG